MYEILAVTAEAGSGASWNLYETGERVTVVADTFPLGKPTLVARLALAWLEC